MPHIRGDLVVVNSTNLFIEGVVLCTFTRLDGRRENIIIETMQGLLYITDEMTVSPHPQRQLRCNHDSGFFYCDSDPPQFFCRKRCDFSMNFDPDYYPEGIAYTPATRYKPGPVGVPHKS